jgi:hypothetical protein
VGCVGCVGGVEVWALWGHSLRSTFPRLHLLRLWTPTILKLFLKLIALQNCNCTVNKTWLLAAVAAKALYFVQLSTFLKVLVCLQLGIQKK